MWLKQGTTEAYAQARQPLEVPPRGVAAITTGGPLTNVVTVRREGKYLMLSHQLIGVNGDRYRLLGPAPVKPPKFAIFQREQQLVAGNFEFG
jgi:hypothetical protein